MYHPYARVSSGPDCTSDIRIRPAKEGGLVEKLLLRPHEAAEILGIGRSKIYALLATGDVPGVRVGRSLRIPVLALQRWVAEKSEAVARSTRSGAGGITHSAERRAADGPA